jgi:hypothetical protein
MVPSSSKPSKLSNASGLFSETFIHDDASLTSNLTPKLTIALALTIILGISYFAYTSFLPRFEEQFISLAILGDEQTLEHYYPFDDPTIGANIPINWYLRLFNHTPEPQNILIQVKVLNATQPSPNSTQCLPSSIPAAFELHTSLAKNKPLIYPFVWYISALEYNEEGVTITEITANDMTASVNTYSVDRNDFRIIFELWIYDPLIAEYVFLQQGLTDRCVWNQIWFNII